MLPLLSAGPKVEGSTMLNTPRSPLVLRVLPMPEKEFLNLDDKFCSLALSS